MFDFMTIAKALSDESRVRILAVLGFHEMCVCQITALLDLAPSTVSKHLSVLRQARLIESSRRGKWVYYSRPQPEAALPAASGALAWVDAALADVPLIQEDMRQAGELLRAEHSLASGDNDRGRGECHSPALHMYDDAIDKEVQDL